MSQPLPQNLPTFSLDCRDGLRAAAAHWREEWQDRETAPPREGGHWADAVLLKARVRPLVVEDIRLVADTDMRGSAH